jgi:hypothetical protein
MHSLKNKIGVTIRNNDYFDEEQTLIASLLVLDTMEVHKYETKDATAEKQRTLTNKVKDILIQSLLRYDEIQKLQEDAYSQGYNAGFHDATVELDPNAQPFNDRGYMA